MPEPTVVKAGEDKPVISAPAAEAATSGPAQPSGTAQPPEEAYRTAELLKHWPALLLAVQKARQAYCSVKQSARVIGWSLDLTEKAVGSVLSFAEDKVSRLRPVVRFADKAVSEGVVVIEKKFPVVRESPEKLYDAITQQITKIVRPTLDKTASISEIGRKKLNRVSRKIVKMYHRLLRRVDSWMDILEFRLNGAEPEAVPSKVITGAEGSVTEPESVAAVSEAPLAVAARLGWRAVSALCAFQVGAACWLLANTPVVGRLFAHPQPSLSSSSSSSSSSSDVSSSSSSSSSRLSPPAAGEEPALSVHSLHPQPSLPEPPNTTA